MFNLSSVPVFKIRKYYAVRCYPQTIKAPDQGEVFRTIIKHGIKPLGSTESSTAREFMADWKKIESERFNNNEDGLRIIFSPDICFYTMTYIPFDRLLIDYTDITKMSLLDALREVVLYNDLRKSPNTDHLIFDILRES